MKKEYVTFHFPNGVNTYAKWAIEVKEGEDVYKIASDVYSLDGVSYLRINHSGKLGNGYKVIDYDDGRYVSKIN